MDKMEKLFIKCYEIERDCQRKWSGLDSAGINSETTDVLYHGVIMHLYNKADPLLLELIDSEYDYQQLYKLICGEINRINKSAMAGLSRSSLPSIPVEISYPENGEDLVNWYKNNMPYRLGPLVDEPGNIVFSFLCISLSYAEYSLKRKFEDDINQPHIHELYSEVNDKDFRNWNLIPVGFYRELKALDPPRLYDSNKDKTLLVDIPKPLVEVLSELQNKKLIGKLSVRCKDSGIFPGNITKEIHQAEVEKGRLFSLAESSWHGVSKLFDSKEYDNQLWINKTDTEWTFEELCQDFSVEGESIVTQMVHLNYEGNLIEHIDYELIFYTQEEYEKRIITTKMDVKGTAKSRRKFFKINEAAIPFDYPCKALINSENGYDDIICPFIFFVLNCYFQHKELLNEYFNDWLQAKEI